MIRTLLTIDGQNDFCDPLGSLYVHGAEHDMRRLASFIRRYGRNIKRARFTLDRHQRIHIASAVCWVDQNGYHPNDYTVITLEQVEGFNPQWRAANPKWHGRYVEYVRALTINGRYPLVIWPPHCVIGTWGESLYPVLANAINDWSAKNLREIEWLEKGKNIFSESYSAVKADVPDLDDLSTFINKPFIYDLLESDEIFVGGEALDYCLCNTVYDIIAEAGDAEAPKFIFLEDTSSSVDSSNGLAEKFIKTMVAKGMRVAKTTDF